jgi:O-acetylhomoserine/O-acetylserine sulfhydrylase-like pyridoxal-dependent enzyme
MKKPVSDETRFGTLAVHAGQEPEPMAGAIVSPIFQTWTYVQPDVAVPKKRYDYARVKNPKEMDSHG